MAVEKSLVQVGECKKETLEAKSELEEKHKEILELKEELKSARYEIEMRTRELTLRDEAYEKLQSGSVRSKMSTP